MTAEPCRICGELPSDNPTFAGLHRYGPTTHDYEPESADPEIRAQSGDPRTVRGMLPPVPRWQCGSYKATVNDPQDRCVLLRGHDGYHQAAARDGMRPWWRHEDGSFPF